MAGPELLAASLPDMSNVATLVYLTEVIELAVRLGTTAAQLKAWSALDLTQTDAANAKQTARARYTLEQWYGIAPALRDVLREKQRDALTAYMLHQGGFGTTIELYNHYLIDSEMSACMLTSRLKLALSSVQLFLQRCLLNLEDEFVAVTARRGMGMAEELSGVGSQSQGLSVSRKLYQAGTAHHPLGNLRCRAKHPVTERSH